MLSPDERRRVAQTAWAQYLAEREAETRTAARQRTKERYGIGGVAFTESSDGPVMLYYDCYGVVKWAQAVTLGHA